MNCLGQSSSGRADSFISVETTWKIRKQALLLLAWPLVSSAQVKELVFSLKGLFVYFLVLLKRLAIFRRL